MPYFSKLSAFSFLEKYMATGASGQCLQIAQCLAVQAYTHVGENVRTHFQHMAVTTVWACQQREGHVRNFPVRV